MDVKFQVLVTQQTWTLDPKTPYMYVISCKWVYKIKRKADGSMERYKARLVAKGYTQHEGVDYDATFPPVVCPTNIGTVLTIAISRGWSIL